VKEKLKILAIMDPTYPRKGLGAKIGVPEENITYIDLGELIRKPNAKELVNNANCIIRLATHFPDENETMAQLSMMEKPTLTIDFNNGTAIPTARYNPKPGIHFEVNYFDGKEWQEGLSLSDMSYTTDNFDEVVRLLGEAFDKSSHEMEQLFRDREAFDVAEVQKLCEQILKQTATYVQEYPKSKEKTFDGSFMPGTRGTLYKIPDSSADDSNWRYAGAHLKDDEKPILTEEGELDLNSGARFTCVTTDAGVILIRAENGEIQVGVNFQAGGGSYYAMFHGDELPESSLRIVASNPRAVAELKKLATAIEKTLMLDRASLKIFGHPSMDALSTEQGLSALMQPPPGLTPFADPTGQ